MINKRAISILKDRIKLIQGDGGKTVYLAGPVQLPVNLDGETKLFQWYCWLRENNPGQNIETFFENLSSSNLAEMQQSSVLVYGDFQQSNEALIRMHSICHTGDIFGSMRCDCGFQLKQSLKMITEHGSGALFYLANHEGRGIGLFTKALAYVLQEEGYDTVDANLHLGFQDDSRNYHEAILVMKELRPYPVTLITNNPKKLEALKEYGMNVLDRVPLWGDPSEFNEKYLETKVRRSGHLKEEMLKV